MAAPSQAGSYGDGTAFPPVLRGIAPPDREYSTWSEGWFRGSRENGAVEVRPARSGDERAIAEVHVRTWQAAYRDEVPETVLDNLSIERRTEGWSRIIAQSAPPAGAFVVEDEGEVVGFAHIARSRDEDADGEVGELTAIYVAPGFWGSGAGTLLLERARAGLREGGFSQATLWVVETNARARRFYESAGWQLDGATKLDKRDGFQLHEVRYRRDLRC